MWLPQKRSSVALVVVPGSLQARRPLKIDRGSYGLYRQGSEPHESARDSRARSLNHTQTLLRPE